ncbi:hypothetical protein V8C40DRAFT_242155 [Trichoderma camerunense]
MLALAPYKHHCERKSSRNFSGLCGEHATSNDMGQDCKTGTTTKQAKKTKNASNKQQRNHTLNSVRAITSPSLQLRDSYSTCFHPPRTYGRADGKFSDFMLPRVALSRLPLSAKLKAMFFLARSSLYPCEIPSPTLIRTRTISFPTLSPHAFSFLAMETLAVSPVRGFFLDQQPACRSRPT